MKNAKISTKIRLLGALLVVSIFLVTSTTIYLNQKNIKDALIVNIAGKNRMLTQKITKNILYIYQTKDNNFKELDNAVTEFKYGMNTLKDGNKLLYIDNAPTQDIKAQISKVLLLWSTFNKNVDDFKQSILSDNQKVQKSVLRYIYNSNNELLQEVDKIVTLYTKHIENKTNFIKKFQYSAMAILLILVIYSILQLKAIESHAHTLLQKSKEIGDLDFNSITPLDIDGESEIAEVADNINCFVEKVKSAINFSSSAVEQSKLASNKLEELTMEINDIIVEIEDKSTIARQLDRSEDIVLESTEDLLKSTKKLEHLRDELDLLLESCKIST